MRKNIKGFILGVFCTLLTINSAVYAVTNSSAIEVMLNSINVTLDGENVAEVGENYTLSNGEEVPFSILYKGTTYLPMREVAELLGKEVTWDKETKTAAIENNKTSKAEMEGNENVDVGINNEEAVDQEETNNAEVVIENLKTSLDFISIDGMYSDPYALSPEEAQVFIIATNEEDFNAFKGLTELDKTKVLNDIVQDNYGHYLGSSNVYVDFVYNGYSYADLKANYGVKAEELEIEVKDEGEKVVVLKQIIDKQELLTYEYYYDNEYKYPYSLTDEEIKQAINEGKKGVDYVVEIEDDQYTFTVDSSLTDELIVVTPYLSIMRYSAIATHNDEVLTFEEAKEIYNDFDQYNFVNFEFSLYTDSNTGHQDLAVYLEQEDISIDSDSFIPMGLDEEGEYDSITSKYKSNITLCYSNMLADVDGRILLDFNKSATFKIVLNESGDIYNIDFSSIK